MKNILIAILALLTSSLLAANCDDISKGSATGINPIVLTLKPGVSQDVDWDFTQCSADIQNFTIHVTQPRRKDGYQPSLKEGTPVQLVATNLTSNYSTNCPGYTCYMGTASSSHILLTLRGTGKKSVDVQVSFTAAY
jgi:hypothetical protein